MVRPARTTYLSIINCNILSFLTILSCSSISAGEPRTWRSSDAKFQVVAEFISATEAEVKLRRADSGKEIVVPLSKLSKADQEFVSQQIADLQKQPVNKSNSSKSTDLKLTQINDQLVEFGPFGNVAIPEKEFQWKLVEAEVPTIEATYLKMIEGNQRPVQTEILQVSVHPSQAADNRFAFLKSLEKAAISELKHHKLRPDLIQSSLSEKSPIDVRSAFYLNFDSHLPCGTVWFRYQFLSDKTIVVKSLVASITDKETFHRSAKLVTSIEESITKDNRWYPETTIDPKVKSDVSELAQRAIQLLKEESYENLMKSLLPDEAFQKLKESPNFEDDLRRFKDRKSARLMEALQSLDWKSATYDPTNQTLTFASPNIRFTKIADRWTLNN
ncbi:MAG: SHD1 domain-containing protein [Pirellulales bacterium]